MEPPKIDAPIRLGRGFVLLYLLALLVALWQLHPWSTDDRYMAVLGVLLFPFLGSLILYAVSLFAWAIATDFRRQKRAFGIFGLVVV